MSDTTNAPRDPAWELLPAYALDAVDDLDRRAVERLLAAEESARHELASLQATTAALVPDIEPPAHLRADVLARLAALDADGDADGARRDAADASVFPDAGTTGAAESADGTVVSLDAARRRRRRRWGVAGIAAAGVLALAVPTGIAVQQAQQRSQLEDERRAVAAILADPDAHLATSDVSTGGRASVLVADGQALFTASDLSDTGDHVYQLWRGPDPDHMVSAGVLTVRGGKTSTLVDAADDAVFAMTVEPEGGSQQPTTAPVVALTVPA
ncbi:anti-sigma factor [Luteimicrobium subarcticum]|uniref:Regulator of SigK n=1 Tax=Luteimicrobium subarcticum TaxID=620910 RepID=A0A2M8WW84_9MICO|nr:anti-sigma factor [Luteimicrobium subarcticum]PJI95171.1 anti-sigma-K factor RskA [Luteimicrobium subarcticum]